MTIHLIKLSVGPENLADLTAWQTQRLKDMKQNRQKAELYHITRHRPKRAEEVLDGGSIYWVIKSMIVARQRLIELRPLMIDGVPHCGLVFDPEMIKVQMRPRRAFQGWRYFEPEDAPPDIVQPSSGEELPDDIQRQLAQLGLL